MAAVSYDIPGLSSGTLKSIFGEYARHMTVDARLADRELIGNLFVGIAGRNQAQHIDLT